MLGEVEIGLTKASEAAPLFAICAPGISGEHARTQVSARVSAAHQTLSPLVLAQPGLVPNICEAMVAMRW